MNFIEAVRLLMEGKKLRRGIWKVEEFYTVERNNKIFTFDNDLQCKDFLANDWEIYIDPNWKASDKIETTNKGICDNSKYIYLEDFKEYIRLVKADIVKELYVDIHNDDIKAILDKRSGLQ